MTLPWLITGGPGGKPVLLMEPNGVDTQPDALAIRGTTILAPSGTRLVATDPAKPVGRVELEFIAETRDQLAFLEEFFDDRMGRALGFWIPSTQWEFDVYGYDMPNFGIYRLWIGRAGYVESMFPLGSRVRQLVLLRGGTYRVHTITGVTASVAPGIDLLAMGVGGDNSTPDVPLVTGPFARRDDSYRPLWLRYVRFDQDALVAETIGTGSARVALAVDDIPSEVPL